MKRIGFFGGSFHPPHKGHVEAAERFLEGAKLSRLLIVPAYLPPHKPLAAGASDEDRYEMARLAFLPLGDRVTVSRAELDRRESRYTVDTLSECMEREGEAEWFLYAGSDLFCTFETWHDFERLFSLCTVCTLARERDARAVLEKKKELEKNYGARVLYLGESRVAASSDARQALLDGKTPEHVPDAVLQYIRTHDLYRKENETC